VKQTHNVRYAWATVIIIAGIIYASLFPFHFHRPPGIRSAVDTLLSTWNLPPGRGDLVANVLFYTPFGLFASLALSRGAALTRAGLVTAAGAALSICMELTQVYDAGRDPAISDVCANTAGTALGVVAAGIIVRRRGLTSGVNVERRPFALILIAFWLAFQLFPYVPVIDLHKYWNAVKPLIFSPQISAVHAYYLAACWLALGAMIEEVAGIQASRGLIVALIGLVLGGRMLISGIALSPDEVIGAAAGAAAWIIAISRVRNRRVIIALAIMAAVILRGLEPFTFQTPPRKFEWIPFRGFIYGSPDLGVPSFFQKAFLYGAMFWALVRAGLKLRAALMLAAGVVFGISFAHRYLPDRSCEVTDGLMVMILAGVFRMVENAGAQPHSATRRAAARGQR
jgi:VanZ family protein